ncbi:MAG TPA: PH domain-containing protein [Anaerolineaceae bacterium]|nr:PH domain-containing protein [Anaerolineaceae bacterium]
MEATRYLPPRRAGLVFHALATAASLTGGISALVAALSGAVGTQFVLFLGLGLLLLVPLPLLLYRGLALFRASYNLERDGLRLNWGLRRQDIPLPEIEWVRPAGELGFHLPLPRLHWPGAILGLRTVPELGPVEFMAASTENMLLLATPDRVYAISPEDPRAFIRAFQRAWEYGSLSPLPAYSARPTAFLEQVWQDRLARIPLLVGLVLTLGLVFFVALLIPTSGPLSLGFDPSGQPFPPGPPERLMLLPVLAAFTLAINLALGLFLYRLRARRPIAYLLWVSSALTPLLLLLAVTLTIL